MKRAWSSVVMVVLAAVIVIVAIDLLAARVSPVVNRREAEDGIRDLTSSNPDVLVLGSSHARSLHVLGQELTARTHGKKSLVAIPLENGKLTVYEWTLQHRLRDLLEQRTADGSLVRDRLKQFILVTEWWDSCPPNEKSRFNYWNLPSRAWAAGDFLDDVVDEGINGYNRNYLQNRARRMFSESALVFDRTNQMLIERGMNLLRGRSLERSPEAELEKLRGWQRNVESGVRCIGDKEQNDSLRTMIRYMRERGVRSTIVLFPRKPATLTAKSKVTTLSKYVEMMQALAREEQAGLVDMTMSSPLTDDDFMEDFDHVNAAGNVKFAKWALDDPLRFLMQPDAASVAGVSR
jgi:hypothetical protein